MSRAHVRARWLLVGCAALACAGSLGGRSSDTYFHNRMDYEGFRSAHPYLLEPNYLPFMTWHAETDAGEALIFCRWRRDDFPLAVRPRR